MAELDQAPMGADNQSSDWRSGITEENRSGVARFETVDGLAKGYSELLRSQSGSVKMLTEDSTPEEKSSFYTKLGRPDTPDGYTRPELADGKSFDEDFIGGMQTLAHEEGISDKQFGKMVERYLQIEDKKAEVTAAEASQVQEQTTRTLQELWNTDCDMNIEMAKRAMRELVPPEISDEFKTLIEDSGLGDNPVFIRGWKEIGSKILDDKFVKSDSTPAQEKGFTPAHPNSPDMYRNGEDEESKNARAYFVARGHVY